MNVDGEEPNETQPSAMVEQQKQQQDALPTPSFSATTSTGDNNGDDNDDNVANINDDSNDTKDVMSSDKSNHEVEHEHVSDNTQADAVDSILDNDDVSFDNSSSHSSKSSVTAGSYGKKIGGDGIVTQQPQQDDVDKALNVVVDMEESPASLPEMITTVTSYEADENDHIIVNDGDDEDEIASHQIFDATTTTKEEDNGINCEDINIEDFTIEDTTKIDQNNMDMTPESDILNVVSGTEAETGSNDKNLTHNNNNNNNIDIENEEEDLAALSSTPEDVATTSINATHQNQPLGNDESLIKEEGDKGNDGAVTATVIPNDDSQELISNENDQHDINVNENKNVNGSDNQQDNDFVHDLTQNIQKNIIVDNPNVDNDENIDNQNLVIDNTHDFVSSNVVNEKVATPELKSESVISTSTNNEAVEDEEPDDENLMQDTDVQNIDNIELLTTTHPGDEVVSDDINLVEIGNEDDNDDNSIGNGEKNNCQTVPEEQFVVESISENDVIAVKDDEVVANENGDICAENGKAASMAPESSSENDAVMNDNGIDLTLMDNAELNGGNDDIDISKKNDDFDNFGDFEGSIQQEPVPVTPTTEIVTTSNENDEDALNEVNDSNLVDIVATEEDTKSSNDDNFGNDGDFQAEAEQKETTVMESTTENNSVSDENDKPVEEDSDRNIDSNDDVFGDFGGFEGSENEQEIKASSNTLPDGSDKAKTAEDKSDINDLGDFEGIEDKEEVTTSESAVEVNEIPSEDKSFAEEKPNDEVDSDDDFGDFGDFEGVENKEEATTSESNAENNAAADGNDNVADEKPDDEEDSDDDFGDFGDFEGGTETEKEATTSQSNTESNVIADGNDNVAEKKDDEQEEIEDDDFGDFGDFERGAETEEEVTASQHNAESNVVIDENCSEAENSHNDEDDSDDDFGDFGGVEILEETAVLESNTESNAMMGNNNYPVEENPNDSFGNFGDLEGVANQEEPAISESAAESGELPTKNKDFVEEKPNDEVDSDDDFGDFGDFEGGTETEKEATTSQSNTESNVVADGNDNVADEKPDDEEDSDDDFGDFGDFEEGPDEEKVIPVKHQTTGDDRISSALQRVFQPHFKSQNQSHQENDTEEIEVVNIMSLQSILSNLAREDSNQEQIPSTKDFTEILLDHTNTMDIQSTVIINRNQIIDCVTTSFSNIGALDCLVKNEKGNVPDVVRMDLPHLDSPFTYGSQEANQSNVVESSSGNVQKTSISEPKNITDGKGETNHSSEEKTKNYSTEPSMEHTDAVENGTPLHSEPDQLEPTIVNIPEKSTTNKIDPSADEIVEVIQSKDSEDDDDEDEDFGDFQMMEIDPEMNISEQEDLEDHSNSANFGFFESVSKPEETTVPDLDAPLATTSCSATNIATEIAETNLFGSTQPTTEMKPTVLENENQDDTTFNDMKVLDENENTSNDDQDFGDFHDALSSSAPGMIDSGIAAANAPCSTDSNEVVGEEVNTGFFGAMQLLSISATNSSEMASGIVETDFFGSVQPSSGMNTTHNAETDVFEPVQPNIAIIPSNDISATDMFGSIQPATKTNPISQNIETDMFGSIEPIMPIDSTNENVEADLFGSTTELVVGTDVEVNKTNDNIETATLGDTNNEKEADEGAEMDIFGPVQPIIPIKDNFEGDTLSPEQLGGEIPSTNDNSNGLISKNDQDSDDEDDFGDFHDSSNALSSIPATNSGTATNTASDENIYTEELNTEAFETMKETTTMNLHNTEPDIFGSLQSTMPVHPTHNAVKIEADNFGSIDMNPPKVPTNVTPISDTAYEANEEKKVTDADDLTKSSNELSLNPITNFTAASEISDNDVFGSIQPQVATNPENGEPAAVFDTMQTFMTTQPMGGSTQELMGGSTQELMGGNINEGLMGGSSIPQPMGGNIDEGLMGGSSILQPMGGNTYEGVGFEGTKANTAKQDFSGFDAIANDTVLSLSVQNDFTAQTLSDTFNGGLKEEITQLPEMGMSSNNLNLDTDVFGIVENTELSKGNDNLQLDVFGSISEIPAPSAMEVASSFVNSVGLNAGANVDDDDDFGDFHQSNAVTTSTVEVPDLVNQFSTSHPTVSMNTVNLNYDANPGMPETIKPKESEDEFGDFHDSSNALESLQNPTSDMSFQPNTFGNGMNTNQLPMVNNFQNNNFQPNTSLSSNNMMGFGTQSNVMVPPSISLNSELNSNSDDFGDFHTGPTLANLNGGGMNSNAMNSNAMNSNAMNSNAMNNNAMNNNAMNNNAMNNNAMNNNAMNSNLGPERNSITDAFSIFD